MCGGGLSFFWVSSRVLDGVKDISELVVVFLSFGTFFVFYEYSQQFNDLILFQNFNLICFFYPLGS